MKGCLSKQSPSPEHFSLYLIKLWSKFGREVENVMSGSLGERVYCLKKTLLSISLKSMWKYTNLNWPQRVFWYWNNVNGKTVTCINLNADKNKKTAHLICCFVCWMFLGPSIDPQRTPQLNWMDSNVKMNIVMFFGISKGTKIIELWPDNYLRLFRLNRTRVNSVKYTHTHIHTRGLIVSHTTSKVSYISRKWNPHTTYTVGAVAKLSTRIKTCLRKINTLSILCKNTRISQIQLNTKISPITLPTIYGKNILLIILKHQFRQCFNSFELEETWEEAYMVLVVKRTLL